MNQDERDILCHFLFNDLAIKGGGTYFVLFDYILLIFLVGFISLVLSRFKREGAKAGAYTCRARLMSRAPSEAPPTVPLFLCKGFFYRLY